MCDFARDIDWKSDAKNEFGAKRWHFGLRYNGNELFAGMMGSEQIKYWLDLHVPILGQVNPVNLISESLYQLYYYTDLSSFYTNLFWLTGFIVLLSIGNAWIERGVRYDAL